MDLNIIVISINVRVVWGLMEEGRIGKAHVQTQQLLPRTTGYRNLYEHG